MVWAVPASAVGAPAERGPSLGPVVWMTSKFVIEMLVRCVNTFAGHRLSGVTEMEKKLPLSATIAPYFFNPRRTAFSGELQSLGILNVAFNRNRCPIAGTFGLVVTGTEA